MVTKISRLTLEKVIRANNIDQKRKNLNLKFLL